MEENKVVVNLDKFKPRFYQMNVINAFDKINARLTSPDKQRVKRFVLVWPRRSGKDIMFFNLLIRVALMKIGVYYYIFPEFAQAKRAIWDSITNDGQRFLDYIPEQIISASNSQELKITLINGSIIQLAGSNKYDSLRGTNPQGIVFSEYAWQDPGAYQALRPILLGNDGWAVFISTPSGKNHFYDLVKHAKQSPDWFCETLTVEDTKHITLEAIEKERQEGLISEDMIQQEYYCSFDRGVEGAYYAKYMERMRLEERIGKVPYSSGHLVHSAWDLGVRDRCSIILFQVIGAAVHIIDYYSNSKQGLEHYVKHLRSLPYIYGKHIAPHDIHVQEFSTGLTRIEKARELGFNFDTAPKLRIEDGIEAVRTVLPRVYINERLTPLIKSLENYRQEWDNKYKVYKNQPLHDQFSHDADAMRYLAVSLHLTNPDITPEELDRKYKDSMGIQHDPFYGYTRF